MDDELWKPVVKNLDTDSAGAANNTLEKLLTEAGDDMPSVAVKLAEFMKELETPKGKRAGLSLLDRHIRDAPETIDMAVELSHDDDVLVRQAAASFLAKVMTNPKARAVIISLLSDSNVDVRNAALSAVQASDLTGGVETASVTVQVIPDDSQREEAIRLLDDLERAVNTVQDLGLSEGQEEIVEELIRPKIEELRRLFGTESDNSGVVIEARKKSMISLSSVIGIAQALAVTTAATTTTVANAEQAGQTVKNTAESLLPLLESFAGLLGF